MGKSAYVLVTYKADILKKAIISINKTINGFMCDFFKFVMYVSNI